MLDRRWLLLPWAVVMAFAFFAATDDYARFQRDKSEQQSALAKARNTLSKTADAWVEEARIIIEQYRTEEERRSIEDDLRELAEKSRQAQDSLKRIPAAAFFPETLRAEESLAARLTKFEEIARGAFAAKTELLNAQAELTAAPARVFSFRQQSRYFWTIRDLINFYRAQDALAQSETSQRDLELAVQQLQLDMEEWQMKLDFQRMASLDDLKEIDESLRRESGMDYSTYIKARLRSFSAWRAMKRL